MTYDDVVRETERGAPFGTVLEVLRQYARRLNRKHGAHYQVRTKEDDGQLYAYVVGSDVLGRRTRIMADPVLCARYLREHDAEVRPLCLTPTP